MKNGLKTIIAIAAFAVFIAAAVILYNQLKQSTDLSGGSLSEVTTADTSEKNETSANTQPDNSNSSSENSETSEEEKIYAPDFTVYDADGNEVTLSSLIELGKPVVINFWATWCGYCKEEMPDFQSVYEEMGEDITFAMINVTDGTRETVEIAQEYVDEKEYTFPVYFDKELDAAQTYGAYSLPTTYFIKADGTVVANALGMISKETLLKGIDMCK